MSSGGVYIYRCRKPGARLRIPLLSWHFAYVGETTSFYHRDQQHRYGLGSYRTPAQPWADLSPYVWLRIPLPRWKWLLRAVETLVILLVWPAYNVQKNRWNPRRIPPRMARDQRIARDRGIRWPNYQALVAYALIVGAVTFPLIWYWIGGRA